MCELPVSKTMQTATMLRALAHNAATNIGDHELILPVANARKLPQPVLDALDNAEHYHRLAYRYDLLAYRAAVAADPHFDAAKDAHDAAHYETRRSGEIDRQVTADVLQAKVYAGSFPEAVK